MTDTRKNRLSVFTNSHYFTFAMMAVGFLFIAGVVFETGVYVGLHKAGFSTRAGDSFERNFGPGGFQSPGMGMLSPHGAFGKIVSVTLPTLTLESDLMPEQTVHVATDTVIRNGSATVASDALTVGTYVIVLGAPNTTLGVVDAKLIRIVPPPPTVGTTTH